MFNPCANCQTPTTCYNTRVCFSVRAIGGGDFTAEQVKKSLELASARQVQQIIGRVRPAEPETLYHVSAVVIDVGATSDELTAEQWKKLKRTILDAGMLAMNEGKHPADMDPIERFSLILGRGIGLKISLDPAGIRVETRYPCAVVCSVHGISVREFPQSQRS